MRFCSACAGPLTLRVPPGDTLPRHVCERCASVHYRNPKPVCGCVVEAADGRLLLCRRAIEPRHGFWTMPAGFMEEGETSAEAAARETREEALAEVIDLRLFCVVDVPMVSQVHLMYRGRLVGGHAPGTESLATALFTPDAIPWDDLAFQSVRLTLEAWCADHAAKAFAVHHLTVTQR